MRIFLRALATLLASLSISTVALLWATAAPAPGWPQAQSDLPADSSIAFGTLPNGMRYLIKQHASPPGGVSLVFSLNVGSLEETGDQAGVAHFVEHMVFRGSRHFADGEALKTLQGLGVSRGVDANAFTLSSATFYMVNLPKNDDASLGKALTVFRDIASEATLDPKTVDSERAVVLSEARLKDTVQARAEKASLVGAVGPDLAQALTPIGRESVIETATADQLRAFYRAWYRPERATLLVVGDVEPQALAKKIDALFSDWKAAAPPGVEPFYPLSVPSGAPRFTYFSEPGAPNTVNLAWPAAHDASPDSRARERADLARILGLTILNHRLGLIASGTDAPFTLARASFGRGRGLDTAAISASVAPGKVPDALHALHDAYGAALRDGVHADELEYSIRATRAAFQSGATGAATIPGQFLSQLYLGTIFSGDVIVAPQAQLDYFEEIVKTLTPAEVTAALRATFPDRGPAVFVSSPAPVEGAEAAFATPLPPPSSALVPVISFAWPYTSFGAPGAITSRTEIADLGVIQIAFANGVRATIKPTKLRAGQVLVMVRFGPGRVGLAEDSKSPVWALAPLLIGGGLAHIDREAMSDVATGKIASLRLDLLDNAYLLRGATRSQDYAFELQLLAAQLTDPAWRADQFQRVKTEELAGLAQNRTSPSGVLSLYLPMVSHDGDPRWQVPTPDDVQSTRLEDVKALFDTALAGSPLEVTVVGDITTDDAISGLQSTFGALSRQFAAPARVMADERRPAPGGKPVILTHKGGSDRAIAGIAWTTAGFYPNPKIAHTLRVLELVLAQRATDTLRTQMGITYDPVSSTFASEVTPTFGYLGIAAETSLAKVPDVYAAIAKITADLRTKEVTADELAGIRDPHVQDLLRSHQTNEYWAANLSGSQIDPRKLMLIRSTVPDIQSVTPADLLQAARTYLDDSKANRLVIVPEGHTGSVLTMR